MDIRDKVAVVTGAGSGIGRATAVRLAREGAAVIVADLDDTGGRETVARIAATGGAATAVHVDVTRETDAHRMLATAEDRYGGLDILCNNAGVTTGTLDFMQASIDQWQRVIDVNLRAVILATHLAVPLLRRRGGGAIVHTASLAAFVGFPPDPVYAATKAGVVLFTHSLGALAAEGIRVNCVCPGVVNTPMLHRTQGDERPAWLGTVPVLEPEDIADGVVQLITDDALAGRALRIARGLRDLVPLSAFEVPRSKSA
jgi:NAD(P)-dependent dehydrogenase (short-subunit alcohol dehydrogenase family)